MTRSERLTIAVEFLKNKYLAKNNREISARIGIDSTNFSKALHGDDRYATDSMLKKFNATYNNIFSYEWLTEGVGDMLSKEKADNMGTTPYYNVDFDNIPADLSTIREDSRIVARIADSADFWCNMRGDSMAPVIANADIIALRKVIDHSLVTYGDIYAIELENGMRMVRRVCPTTDSEILSLVPTNTTLGYAIQEVKRENIVALYAVVASLRKL